MTGRRQHYIPRLLQRGFLADPAVAAAERTWLHRRGTSAKLVGIRDVGVEEWFYSQASMGSTPTLDDAITEFESDLSLHVERLRTCPMGSVVDGSEAAQTLVHLVMRTAHLRKIISTGAARIFTEIESMFTDPARLSEMIGLNGPTLAASVATAIRESTAELVPSGTPHAFAERFASFELREHGDYVVEKTAAAIGLLFPELFSGIAKMVRQAHNRALEASRESNAWTEALAAFEWELEAGADLILPDAIALARENEGSLLPMLFTKAANIRAVAMPVSSERLLIGRASGSEKINITSFNEDAAASCESFFIAAKPFNDEKLTGRIASAFGDLIEEAVATAVRESDLAGPKSAQGFGSAQPRITEKYELSYSIRLADFGSDNYAKEVSHVLQIVIGALAQHIPLNELDGITFGVDYNRALAELDRGDPELLPTTSSALEYGASVAKVVAVVRNGVSKAHLVMTAGIAEAILSSNTEIRQSGIYMVVNMLARIAHSSRYPDVRSVELPLDPMKRLLHSAVADAPVRYWGARVAADLYPTQGQFYAELVIGSLDYAEQQIARERSQLRSSDEIDSAVSCAVKCVSGVLGHVADWLGHRDGLDTDQMVTNSDFTKKLKERGLYLWVELFGRDLSACYDSDDALDLDVASSLSSHVERLLWSFGIYGWPDGSDVRFFVTDRPFLPPRLAADR